MNTKLALLKALEQFCSYRDRSACETRRKGLSIGMSADEWIEVESHLFSEGFLNDQRFAENFIRGKIKHNSWGRLKIFHAISLHKIERDTISKAWGSIDTSLYQETLSKVLSNKWKSLESKEGLEKRQACVRFALSKGFELDEILNTLKELDLE